MSFSGFKTTRKGRQLIAKVLAEKSLTISRVMAGAGICESESDIDDLEDLIDSRTQGTSTNPKYDVETMTMTVEFRRDLHEGELEGFWLSEFGIFAIDPDEGEILMYYYSFGDEPQHLNGTSSKTGNVLRYPVSVTIGEDMEVISLGYPASAFLMPQDLLDHENDPDAHANLRGRTHVSATMPDNFTVGDTWWKIPQLEPEYPEEDVIPDPEPDAPDVAPELETNDVFKGGDAYDLRPTDEIQELNMTVDGIDKGVPFVEKITDSIYKLT